MQCFSSLVLLRASVRGLTSVDAVFVEADRSVACCGSGCQVSSFVGMLRNAGCGSRDHACTQLALIVPLHSDSNMHSDSLTRLEGVALHPIPYCAACCKDWKGYFISDVLHTLHIALRTPARDASIVPHVADNICKAGWRAGVC